MKRKKQIVLYVLLIIVLSYFYLLYNRLYFSAEDVFYACERGLRSGPSEEIVLKYELGDDAVMVVGRQEDGLFVVPAERTHLFLWRMKSGGIDGEYRCDGDVDGYLSREGKVLGLCRNPEIAKVSFIVGNWGERNWQEFICTPDEDGFIYYETDFENMDDYVIYWEGRNADGEVIYADGEDGLAESLRSEIFTPEAKEVTKPFITAPDLE